MTSHAVKVNENNFNYFIWKKLLYYLYYLIV